MEFFPEQNIAKSKNRRESKIFANCVANRLINFSEENTIYSVIICSDSRKDVQQHADKYQVTIW